MLFHDQRFFHNCRVKRLNCRAKSELPCKHPGSTVGRMREGEKNIQSDKCKRKQGRVKTVISLPVPRRPDWRSLWRLARVLQPEVLEDGAPALHHLAARVARD